MGRGEAETLPHSQGVCPDRSLVDAVETDIV